MMPRICTFIAMLMLTTSCETTKTIYVSGTIDSCENDSSQKCLQVKENKEDEWTLIPNTIEGFEHKEGYLQKIKVKILKVKNPSANESAPNYEFVELFYEEKDIFKIPFSLILDKNHAGKWQVNTMVGVDSLAKLPTLIFKDGRVSGNAGCNNYGATFTLSENNITFSLTHATKMFCANMQLEKAFFNCLSQIKTYKYLDDKLIFYNFNNEALITSTLLK